MSTAPSGFDPQAFLDAQTQTANVRRPPLPVMNPASPDGLYTAIIGEVKTEAGTIEKGDRVGKPWLSMHVPLALEVPSAVQDALGIKLEKGIITFTDRVFIDLNDQNLIDNSVGRNRRQRVYREALDLNKPGDTWSWRMAQGKPVKVKIDHEVYQGEIVERIGIIMKFA